MVSFLYLNFLGSEVWVTIYFLKTSVCKFYENLRNYHIILFKKNKVEKNKKYFGNASLKIKENSWRVKTMPLINFQMMILAIFKIFFDSI